MRGGAAVVLVQAVRRRLERGKGHDPGDQFVDLPVGLEERAQVQPTVAEQAQVQLALGRQAEPVAGGAEILRIGAMTPIRPLASEWANSTAGPAPGARGKRVQPARSSASITV